MADNKELKRYEVLGGFCTFGPDAAGDWVKHEDATAALSELRAEVERLKAELKRLQPHAARYKWLRDRHSGEFEKIILMSEWCSRSDWDNAIDAARSAASGESAEGGV